MNNDENEARRLHNLINNDDLDTTANDLELAKQLQEQFDKEQLDYLDNVNV